MAKKGFTTTNLHSDRRDNPEHGVLHKAIHPSVAYGYEDAHHLAEVFQGKRAGYNYGRQLNPTVTALQKRITNMEGGIASVAFATGMGAITSSLLSLLRQGDHIVSSTYLFGNTNSLFLTLQTLGIEVSFVDATAVSEVENAIQENTKLVFVETIANPATQIADLEAIGQLCAERKLIYFVDNTLTTPHLFQPKNVGASLVINSLTKYIGGHGNALGGAITDTGLYDWTGFPNIYDIYKTGDENLWAVTQIKKKGLRDMGATLGPEAAHHLAVGSETLTMRVDKACANAMALAQLCENHPKVKQVYYPGLQSHPQHELAKSLFSGFGAIFSLDLQDEFDCFDFLNKLDCVVASSNLGDTRTLAIPVAHTIYYEMGAQRRASMGIADSMVRFSVGIENTEDLLTDIEAALS
ncbi:MAG: cystathionine gamma-synthase family protein [Gammaproteobacteria bacterium]|jgi:O-acetylhomoserine (thiol)-lyase|nr:cystathionine gamma-synthase family protein [Gammaproteobacteria bacterium]MDP7455353.1 cystathionine gamma-synthase family protein [Gammaproteobacteria bacterium]|tara:strand:+ start:3088 stop:4317 length:1230 start_codon:yes stop_codon:yes gene_type:complete